MAIPSFAASFQDSDITQLLTKFDNYTGATPIIGTSTGRGGGRCLEIGFGGFALGKYVAAGNTSAIAGARVKIASNAARAILTFRNTANAVNHLTLLINASGYLELRRGNVAGTLLATGTTLITLNTFHSVSLKASINGSTGSYTVKVNGVTEASMVGTSQNTQSGGSADITGIYLFSVNDPVTLIFVNDFFILDGAVSQPGDVYVDYLVTNGAGNYQDFTPSSGSTHYLLLDEIPPNTTDYVSSATTGQKETNATANITGTASTILFVQSVNYALKSDAGTAQLRNLIRSASTDATGPTVAMSGSAQYYVAPHDVDPATGVAWTISGVNAMEVGLENVT